MFNLPDYPDVYNTRHITCVCCKEKFAVTEGHQGKNPDHNRWRVLPNEAQKIRLRHEPNREQRSILPTTREMPLPQENVPLYFQQPPVAFSPAALNCPRCGADNANWISLNQTGNRSILQVWRLRFPDVFVARALALAFMAFALVLFFVMKIHIGKAIILFFFIPAAIVGVIWELTREWNHLRENKHIKRVVPKTKDKERELWIRGGALVFLFTLVFPVIFFSLAPTAFNIFLEFTQDSPESQVEEASTAVSLIVNQQIDATEEEFAAIAKEMQQLIDRLPTQDLPGFEAEVATLSDKLADTVAASEIALEQVQAENATAIQTRREEELEAVAKARDSAIAGLANGLVADVRFLALWALLVGPPTLVTVLIAMAAVKQFVNRVDRDLPFPIFHTVAGMTRLVAWEAMQTLEVRGQQFSNIQWMSVDRNAEGGLDLVGLFRDPPEFDAFGQVRSDLVRAQLYTIHTDLWGRVRQAKIEDVMVPVPAGAPAGIMQFPAQHDAPSEVRIRLPQR